MLSESCPLFDPGEFASKGNSRAQTSTLMWVIYRLALGGEPPLVIGASSVCSLGENVQSLWEALPLCCTWQHAGQKQTRLPVWMADQVQKALFCAGVTADNNLASRPADSQLSCQSWLWAFMMRTVGKQFSPAERWNNRSQPTTGLTRSSLAPEPSPII